MGLEKWSQAYKRIELRTTTIEVVGKLDSHKHKNETRPQLHQPQKLTKNELKT